MSLYIQHGHGKSDKIDLAIQDGSANGIIFSARNEKIEKLDDYLRHLADSPNELELLFDPQFFVSVLTPANDRFLSDYSYYSPARAARDFIGSRNIAAYAKEVVDFQVSRIFTRVVSPTVLVRSFSDQWSQISLQLADASVEYHEGLTDKNPLMVKVLLSETALDSREELDSFLDVLTSWDVHGYHLVIARDDPTYDQTMDPDRLAHLLYMIYVLSDRNGFEVVCGYSDFIGIACQAVGAKAFANGWYQSLRQFHVKSFLKRKPGGSRALLRYSSGPLLTSLRLSELESIHDAGHLNSVLSNVPLDEAINTASSPVDSDWTGKLSERHHWQTLSSLNETYTEDVRSNIINLLRSVRSAQGLFTLLQASGVPFDRNFQQGHQYNDWLVGIQRFATMVGIG